METEEYQNGGSACDVIDGYPASPLCYTNGSGECLGPR